MQVIDPQLLQSLSAAAKETPRRRKNCNLHQSYDEPCQRLLNAVEPDSYIRPHRHLTPLKPETFLLVRGQFAIFFFNDAGEGIRVVKLSPDGALGLDIPAGAWHTVLSLETGSVFFEAKPGPYQPLSDKDWAPWAPEEGSADAPDYLNALKGKLNQ